ncbi:Tn3 family transposase [Micromonospora echinofusca]|uniref:Tn3 family transposase n=1 Tax=Micromonospora echinofusca TaxID=47858 RepID=UPI0033E0C721
MATRLFPDDQMERLKSYPDIGTDELIRFFTLTAADAAFVSPGRGRGPTDRLGLAVQLCTLPWLGFVPDEVRYAPPAVVARLAGRLGVDPQALERYGERPQTRTDHLRLVCDYLRWKSAPTGGIELKELEEFLLGRALEHDSPTTLFNLACEYLIANRTVRPGVVRLLEMVATARTTARTVTHDLLAPLLTGQMTADLDLLPRVDAGLGMTRLAWLTKPAVDATATSIKTSIEKLTWVRAMDGHLIDLSMLAAERRRFLATIGRRLTGQALERRDDERRYPILLTLVAQSAVDLLDEVVGLFDQAVSAREARAKGRTEKALAERGKSGESRQALLDMILPVLADPGIPDEQVGGLLRGQIGMGRIREAAAMGWPALPRDNGQLAEMNASYNYLRQFVPQVLAAIDFRGGPGADELMQALAMLAELSRTGTRKVPAGVPDGFVPARFRDYLTRAQRQNDDVSYRHYWELCVLLGVRDGLRSGDVFVPGSRRYADPSSYLFTEPVWATRRDEFCALVGKPADGRVGLEQGLEELHTTLGDLERVLADTGPDEVGSVRLDEQGNLVIPPLSAEDVPAEATTIKEELAGMLPFAPIASLLIELDHRTGFLSCFTHAGGRKQAMSGDLKRNILAVLIANATNLGLVKMAEACGVPYDVLAWTQEWYVREETLREANTVIVNHHHGLAFAKVFGGGTMSSSDGQRFPTRGKSLTARAMNTFFADEGLSTYTHVSDQHSTYGTKVIVPTTREAHYVLDDFLGNATDLPIAEHATDTHGVTLINFALFDLVGKALTPRIRDLGKVTLCRDDTPTVVNACYPHAGPLLTDRLDQDLIVDMWPDLLRMAGSLKFGQATASLIVGKWSAASRQNTLAIALKEWGTLRRTIHSAKYLSDPVYRRKIGRQLNKGESLHALRRDLHYANQGSIRRRHLEQQTEQAWCLTVLTNAVITWTTEYYAMAVDRLRAAGRDIPDELLAHISPAHSENINFFGTITVDIEAELAKLDERGVRPLRGFGPGGQ